MEERIIKGADLKKTWPIWAAVFALGILMVFFRIGSDAVWYDESYSVAAAEHPVLKMIPMIGMDSHPPLYFIMLRGMMLVFGHSPAAVRALSALGIIALALLGFFPLRKIIGEKGGLAFSLITFVTPMSIVSAHEARMYSWTAFFVTAMVVWGYLAFSGNRKRDWLVLALFSLAAAFTHYFGLIAAGLYWLVLLVLVIGKKDRKSTIFWLVAGVSLLVLYTPWFWFLSKQASRVIKNYWIPPVDLFTVIRVVSYPFTQKFKWIPNPWALLLFLIVLGCGIAGVIVAARKKDKRAILPLSGLIVYILTLLASLVLSKVFRPILMERYMISCMGVLLLGLAVFAGQWKKWWITLIPLFLYAASGVSALKEIYDTEINGPMDIVQAELKDLVKPGDIFIHGSEHNMGTFAYYFPENRHYLYIPEKFVPFSNYEVFSHRGSYGSDFMQFNDEPVTLWVTNRAGEPYSLPFSLIGKASHRRPAGPVRRYSKEPGWYSVSVQRIEFDPDKTEPDSETSAVGNGTLKIIIKGINPELKGWLMFGLYNSDPISPDNFLVGDGKEVSSDTIEFSIENLDYGSYAFYGFHDTNENQRPDFEDNKPMEGMAVSFNAPYGGGQIDFSMLEFPFDAGHGQIELQISYF
jgi:uncharacterized protein (DUF2141 family)